MITLQIDSYYCSMIANQVMFMYSNSSNSFKKNLVASCDVERPQSNLSFKDILKSVI